MDKPKLVGMNGNPIGVPPQPSKQEPPKQIPEGVKVIQINSLNTVGPMGSPGIVLFGLADNGEVYVWNAKERVWLEH